MYIDTAIKPVQSKFLRNNSTDFNDILQRLLNNKSSSRPPPSTPLFRTIYAETT